MSDEEGSTLVSANSVLDEAKGLTSCHKGISSCEDEVERFRQSVQAIIEFIRVLVGDELDTCSLSPEQGDYLLGTIESEAHRVALRANIEDYALRREVILSISAYITARANKITNSSLNITKAQESTDDKRPLGRSDLQLGNEFTIAQDIVQAGAISRAFLRVGDVIMIRSVGETTFEISVNDHSRGEDSFVSIPIDEVGDYIIKEPK